MLEYDNSRDIGLKPGGGLIPPNVKDSKDTTCKPSSVIPGMFLYVNP